MESELLVTQYAFSRLPAIGEAVDPCDLEAITAVSKDAVIALFEGDYSSYSLVKSVVTTETGIFTNSHFNADEDKALLVCSYKLLIVTIPALAITTVSGGATSGRVYWADQARSLFNKYAAFVDSNNQTINIYKDGVLIDSIDVDDAGTNDYWDGIVMSLSGEYILAIHRDNSAVPDVYTLRLYGGS